MIVKSSDLYVNPMHKFYAEFVQLAKKTLNLGDKCVNDFTIEELISMGMKSNYYQIYKQVAQVTRFLNFTYDSDFVLMHYKPYYVLYPEFKKFKEENNISDDIKTPWDILNGILRYGRGIVFHRYTGAVVINPYSKFFNLDEMDECSEEKIHLKIEGADVVEFSEKLDGSMINARWYNGKLVTSSSTGVGTSNMQLWEARKLIDERYESMLKYYRNLTFMFELISPKDAHVVDYGSENKLVLIGIKSTKSEYTCPYSRVCEIAEKYGIPHAELYKTSFKEILANRDAKKANEAEGFVANIDGYRVKIKYEDYLKMHGLATNLTPNGIIKAMADNCVEELKLACPSRVDFIEYIMSRVDLYVNVKDNMIKYYYAKAAKAAPQGERKDFMVAMQEITPPSLCKYVIMMFDNKYSDERLLRSGAGSYLKYTDVENYLENH